MELVREQSWPNLFGGQEQVAVHNVLYTEQYETVLPWKSVNKQVPTSEQLEMHDLLGSKHVPFVPHSCELQSLFRVQT